MTGFIPKEKLTAYQRWEVAAFDEAEQAAAAAARTAKSTPIEAEAAETADQPPVVLPTAADIERMHIEAHEQGYAAGYEEGIAEAKDIAARIDVLLTNVQQAIAALDQQVADQLLATSVEIASQMLRQSLRVKPELQRCLFFVDFADIHFISALHGSGVGHLFESLQEAYQSATRRIGTSLLTRVMHMAQEDHQPPLVRGRRVKLKYAHAGGYNPPRIIIHGNQVKDLPDSYKRYLMNYYRKSLKIMGTPIHIEFQEGENPFEGKKNQLTQSQIRKRRRLMKHVK